MSMRRSSSLHAGDRHTARFDQRARPRVTRLGQGRGHLRERGRPGLQLGCARHRLLRAALLGGWCLRSGAAQLRRLRYCVPLPVLARPPSRDRACRRCLARDSPGPPLVRRTAETDRHLERRRVNDNTSAKSSSSSWRTTSLRGRRWQFAFARPGPRACRRQRLQRLPQLGLYWRVSDIATGIGSLRPSTPARRSTISNGRVATAFGLLEQVWHRPGRPPRSARVPSCRPPRATPQLGAGLGDRLLSLGILTRACVRLRPMSRRCRSRSARCRPNAPGAPVRTAAGRAWRSSRWRRAAGRGAATVLRGTSWSLRQVRSAAVNSGTTSNRSASSP